MMSDFELYVHIPFCVKKCDYCDFASGIYDSKVREKYTERLCREIKSKAERYNGCVTSIYIGGGTPSSLELPLMERILSAIKECFWIADDAEYTMEMNPGTVSAEAAREYAWLGVNRASIGLQSANDEELRALGRIHTYQEFLEAYEHVRRSGISNVNVDIMTGLPGQKKEKLAATLHEVTMVRPEHVSAYSLMIEEGTPFYKKYGEDARRQAKGLKTHFLPTDEEAYNLMKLAERELEDHGYAKYEISNYAEGDHACRHNIGYWRRKAYVGVGLSASSFMTKELLEESLKSEIEGFYEERIDNTRSMEDYLEGTIAGSSRVLTKEDAMAEFMYLGLRMTEGVYASEFYEKFGVGIEHVYGDSISMLTDRDFLVNEDGRIYLTEVGMDLSNRVLAEFLPG